MKTTPGGVPCDILCNLLEAGGAQDGATQHGGRAVFLGLNDTETDFKLPTVIYKYSTEEDTASLLLDTVLIYWLLRMQRIV